MPGPFGLASSESLFTENEIQPRSLFRNGRRTIHTFVRTLSTNMSVGGKTRCRQSCNMEQSCRTSLRARTSRRRSADGCFAIGFGNGNPPDPLGSSISSRPFATRIAEADDFYASIPKRTHPAERDVIRQAYAGLLWSKQFYHYIVDEWLEGDPVSPSRLRPGSSGRNQTGIISTAATCSPCPISGNTHGSPHGIWPSMSAYCVVDPQFAKEQLLLLLREWYMHPNGQSRLMNLISATSIRRCMRGRAGGSIKSPPRERRARPRISRTAFPKVAPAIHVVGESQRRYGEKSFRGGFLGLDNIGVFDRWKPLPNGGTLRQADGTAWMAFYCGTMLSIALELAKDEGSRTHPAYEDMASKFFEHFVQIADAMNHLGGTGLWNEEHGFYYDAVQIDGGVIPLHTRSVVGLLPLIAVEILEEETITKLPGFYKRLEWFVKHRPDLAQNISYCEARHNHRLLAIPSRARLERVLKYMLDENEFLSPYGLRSVSKFHQNNPYLINAGGAEHRVDYEPGESTSGLFGGNSNWRGPIWFPINFLILEALERYHHFYGESFQVECPTGSGRMMNLHQVAIELSSRLASIFLPDASGRRPCHGDDSRFVNDPNWRDLVLFHEYFHGETGQGLGASHQTGWTALAIGCIADIARMRSKPSKQGPVEAVTSVSVVSD